MLASRRKEMVGLTSQAGVKNTSLHPENGGGIPRFPAWNEMEPLKSADQPTGNRADGERGTPSRVSH